VEAVEVVVTGATDLAGPLVEPGDADPVPVDPLPAAGAGGSGAGPGSGTGTGWGRGRVIVATTSPFGPSSSRVALTVYGPGSVDATVLDTW
jgi:hypothetical protein